MNCPRTRTKVGEQYSLWGPFAKGPWDRYGLHSFPSLSAAFSQGLPPAMQKVMYKGLVPEEKTLREIRVTSGAKIMVVGSTINDVLAVNTPKDAAQQDAKAEESKKEPLCRQKVSPHVAVRPGTLRAWSCGAVARVSSLPRISSFSDRAHDGNLWQQLGAAGC